MNYTWYLKGELGFGLADLKKEGHTMGPSSYLTRYGEWPTPGLYTKTELSSLQREGWSFKEVTHPEPTKK